MRDAPVGHQCVECVTEGSRNVRPVRTVFGGRQRNSVPVVTYVLIALNVVMFVLMKMLPDLYGALVLWPEGIAYYGQLYRLATSAFMHVDVMHILFNMWALYVVGPALERWLGRTRFIGLYALSALGGSLLVYLLADVDSATLGASGAIFGLFGATFVLARRLEFDVRFVVGLIVINLVFTFAAPLLGSQPISWQGHIGGLLTGAAVAWVYAYAPRSNRALIQAGFSIVLLLVFAALIWWRTVSILAGAQ